MPKTEIVKGLRCKKDDIGKGAMRIDGTHSEKADGEGRPRKNEGTGMNEAAKN